MSQLRAGIRNSQRSSDGQVRPNTIYGTTGTFGGPAVVTGQRPAFPTDSNLVLVSSKISIWHQVVASLGLEV